MTKIQWTEQTWNPIVGCTITTPGCTNCYAMKAAYRMGHNPKTPQYHGLTKKVNGNAVWTGKMNLAESVLLQPFKRKKPTMYFVNSMGDLFHESVPDEWIDRVFAVMALCPQHTFQVLTKRADRMREYMTGDMAAHRIARPAVDFMLAHKTLCNAAADAVHSHGDIDFPDEISIRHWPLPNVWLGVSVEDQTRADERIPLLLDTPAAVRFVSAEPLLGAVQLNRIAQSVDTFSDCGGHPDPAVPLDSHNALWLNALGGKMDAENREPNGNRIGDSDVGLIHEGGKIDWVIVGGESGPKARPMHPDWARSLRDQCVAAGVPFFFKQWGEWADQTNNTSISSKYQQLIFTASGETLGAGWRNNGCVEDRWKERGGAWMVKVGTKAAGNLLDGKEWQQMPEVG
ncbi:MAG: phage Gp37/Gp68 family protein [Rhodobacteraceae bacterium]|nr:phage Gp37/Gp68 family protein [Paracoccaceae bacterium]